eukprot:Gb_03818 [translate_table: standard]
MKVKSDKLTTEIGPHAFLYWTAKLVAEQVAKIRTSIHETKQSLNLVASAKILERIPRRKAESPHNLLEFEPVGINRQVMGVKQLLEMEGSSPSVAVILYGFGGVGKSTLAMSVIDKLNLTNYKFCRVIVDAENPAKNLHIAKLQKNILSALGEEKIDFDHPDEGRQMLRKAFENNSFLLFIDNIVEENYVKQLLPKKMSGEKQKMRIIITSRTNTVRQELSLIDSDCIRDYSVERLSDETAIELLSTTIGVRSQEAYKYALDSLQQGNFQSCSDTDLSRQVLYVYDKMEEEAKETFLDICVFFYGWKWDLIAFVVGEMRLKNLINRALVKKNKSNEMIVHDVLRLMGRIRAEGTRVQSIEELSKVLEKGHEAITKVKGIWLLDNESRFNFQSKDLEEMHPSLWVLALGNCTMLDSECRKIFYNLRFLQVGNVDTFPFQSISKFENLAVIHNESMSGMRLPELPPALKQIKLTLQQYHNYASATLPISWKNIGFLEGLEKFEIQSRELVEFPEEFVLPMCMKEVDLSTCKQLPKGFDRLTALRKLTLKNCSKLNALPREFLKLPSIVESSVDDRYGQRKFSSKFSGSQTTVVLLIGYEKTNYKEQWLVLFQSTETSIPSYS